ncbi:hypothetical protein HN51_020990 [Arachis hypogaea]
MLCLLESVANVLTASLGATINVAKSKHSFSIAVFGLRTVGLVAKKFGAWGVAVFLAVPSKYDAFETHPMNFLNERTQGYLLW